MSDDELNRIERAIKRYLSYYWWAIIPAIVGGTVWVTHQNSIAADTLESIKAVRTELQVLNAAQHVSDLATQHVTDELGRHEWMATNHENRLQWLEHRNERP
jgi:hypothetical protein